MAIANALPEKERNRLLRRADWRFLLPNPQPGKSICFATGLMAKAIELVSGCVADARLDPSGDCDLAVAVNPNDATLRTGWAALRPGGSFYAEWYSPLAGGPKGVRRRLEAVGFEGVTCYWTWPWPSLFHPRFWLPLDAPGALRYFLSSRPPDRGIVRRLGKASLWSLERLSLRLGLTLPLCATARKPALAVNLQPSTAGPIRQGNSRLPSASGMIPHLLDTIRAKWDTWGFSPPPDHLSSLILTGGHRSVGKVVRLVFSEPDHHPRLAIKMPRVPESVPGLTREAATLRALQVLRPDDVRGVPRVLFCQEHAGLLTVGETAVVGLPLSTILRRDNYRALALKTTDWLASLAGRPELCPPATWWNRLIEPVLASFDELFGRVVDPGMRRETGDILATVGAFPLVCEQRDFGPWNVLSTANGELAVLDWESSELQGLPGLDLIYFLSFLALFLDDAIDSGHLRKSFRATLNPSTFTGGILHECLARYASQIGLNPAKFQPLRLLVWMLHSRSEYQWFVADVAGRPERDMLRRSLFVSLWEEEFRSVSRI